MGCLCVMVCLEGVCEGLVELLQLLFGELSVSLGGGVFFVLLGTFDIKCDVDEVVIGVECCCGVAGDVVYHGPPRLWAEGVVELYKVTRGALVGVSLLWGLGHPSLWEAEGVL